MVYICTQLIKTSRDQLSLQSNTLRQKDTMKSLSCFFYMVENDLSRDTKASLLVKNISLYFALSNVQVNVLPFQS